MPGTRFPAPLIFSGRPGSHPSRSPHGPGTAGSAGLAPRGPGKAQHLHPAPHGPSRAIADAAARGLRAGDPSPSSARTPRAGLVPPALSAAPGAAHSPAPPVHGRVRRSGGSGLGAERGSGVGRCPPRPGSRPGPAPGPALPDGRCSSAREGQHRDRGAGPAGDVQQDLLGLPGNGGAPGAGGDRGLELAGLCQDAFESGRVFMRCFEIGMCFSWNVLGPGQVFQWDAFRPRHAFRGMVLVWDGVSGGFPPPRRIGVLLGMGKARQTAAALEWGSPESSVLKDPPTVRTTVPWIYDQQHTWRGRVVLPLALCSQIVVRQGHFTPSLIICCFQSTPPYLACVSAQHPRWMAVLPGQLAKSKHVLSSPA